jgi:hypothetical protein
MSLYMLLVDDFIVLRMGVCNASLQAVHCDNGIGAALHNVLYMAIKCEYLFCT